MPENIQNEQEKKREFDKQRIRSRRSEDLDNRLARHREKSGSSFSEEERQKMATDESWQSQRQKIEKKAAQAKRGAEQIAAGNKVKGAANLAKGAAGLATQFFGGFMSLGVLWYFMLMAAGMKDVVDIMSLETVWWIDWMVDVGVAALLWVYIAVHGARKAQVVKFAAPLLEILPITGMIPWWTISVIYVGIMKSNK